MNNIIMNKSKRYYIGDPSFGMNEDVKNNWFNKDCESGYYSFNNYEYFIGNLGEDYNCLDNFCFDSGCISIIPEELFSSNEKEMLQFGIIIEGPIFINYKEEEKYSIKSSNKNIFEII